MGSHFGVGEFTTHFRTYLREDWDVHWGYGILTHGHLVRAFKGRQKEHPPILRVHNFEKSNIEFAHTGFPMPPRTITQKRKSLEM